MDDADGRSADLLNGPGSAQPAESSKTNEFNPGNAASLSPGRSNLVAQASSAIKNHQGTSPASAPFPSSALGESSMQSGPKEHGSTGVRTPNLSAKITVPPNFAQQNVKAVLHCTAPALNEFRCLVPGGTAQQQALQQQAVHQAALHQKALKQHNLHHSTFKHSQQHRQLAGNPQHVEPSQSSVTHQGSTMCSKGVKVEPMDADRVSALDSASHSGHHTLVDSCMRKDTEAESKASVSLASVGESKEIDSARRNRSEGVDDHDSKQYLGPQMTRGGVFADLNAEPPASEGEDAIQGDTLHQNLQPKCDRMMPDESRQRKKQTKDNKGSKDGDDDCKKTVKAGKSRSKFKGEAILETGVEGEMDLQATVIPSTQEESIKSLKAGLIHVARKLPKNAHAHFVLGLMYQRLGQPAKASAAFKKAGEILKQAEEESGQNRPHFSAVVHGHYAQSVLQGNLTGQASLSKELHPAEVDDLVQSLKEAIQTDPGHVLVWNSLGMILIQSGRIQSAISVLRSLLSVTPDCLDALSNLGVAYMHSGHLAHATRCLQLLLEKDSSHPGALLNYGALLLRQYSTAFAGAGAGCKDEAQTSQFEAASTAQQCLVAALKTNPKAGHVWVNLAAAYSVAGDSSSAGKCLEQASRLEPNRMSTRYAVAMQRVCNSERSHEASEQLSWAANEMASILKDGNPANIQSHIAWAGLAMVNRAQHEVAASFEGDEVGLTEIKEKALYTLQQAIEANPDDTVQWHQLGLHTLCTLQFRSAQTFLKTAIAHQQNSATTWLNLGIALQLSEDLTVAEGVYQKALSMAARDQAHTIWSNLGNLYRQQRRFADAHEAFKKALDLCADYAPACNNLGLLLIAEGKLDEAVNVFNRALLSDPFLDAAKSNKMKAEALVQIQRSKDTFHVSRKDQPAPSESSFHTIYELSDSCNTVLPGSRSSHTISVNQEAVVYPKASSLSQREPFPLPSTS